MKKKYEIELVDTIKKHALLIIILALVVASLLCVFKRATNRDVYVAKTSIAVSDEKGQNGTYNDVRKSKSLVGFYCRLANSSITLDRVIKRTGFKGDRSELLNMVTVVADTKSQYIDIEVRSSNVNTAKKVAIGLAQSVKEIGSEIRNEDILTITTYPNDQLTVEKVSLQKYFAAGFFGGIIIFWICFSFVDQKKNKKKNNKFDKTRV